MSCNFRVLGTCAPNPQSISGSTLAAEGRCGSNLRGTSSVISAITLRSYNNGGSIVIQATTAANS